MTNVDFLGCTFDVASLEDWVTKFSTAHEQTSFEYIVTPNVDGVLRYHDSPDFRDTYKIAKFRVCDSRILELLARFKGIDIPAIPGSDIVQALFKTPSITARKIAIIGPSRADFDILKQRYPAYNLILIDAPNPLIVGSKEWDRCLSALESESFDILLACITSPKMELLCYALTSSTHVSGLGICCGASIDFLTGRQKRAPEVFQRIRLEWPYRLASNPKRLWRRYLIEGPRIFRLVLRS